MSDWIINGLITAVLIVVAVFAFFLIEHLMVGSAFQKPLMFGVAWGAGIIKGDLINA